MEYRVLGPIEVVGDDGPIALGGEKPRAVLATLLLAHGRPVSIDRLVDAVWDRPPASAAHAVTVYVSRLRAAIASANGVAQPLVTREPGYALEIGEALDLTRFRALASDARAAASVHDPATAWEILERALGLWRGPPLACLTSTPIADSRLELADERLAVLEDRLEAGLALGHHVALTPELRTLTREHPERERLWAALMLALYRAGRQAEALDTYREAHSNLDTKFGLEPGPRLRELQHRILTQDIALDHERIPVAPLQLPSPPSSFVGRAAELDDASRLIDDLSPRLLTVVGPGGVGKTRFALELARRLGGRFPDGVHWVGLDALDDASRVIAETAVACGADGVHAKPFDALATELAGRRALLLLDNFEHVLEAAEDVHRLLARVPTVAVLATSRVPLSLSCEHVLELPPLSPTDAEALFVARLRAVSPDTRADAVRVAELCERLDRLPLAIELATSHARIRSLAEILEGLTRSFELGPRRDPPARQRTLRATLDWSWELLGDDARRALSRLAVFAGGFSVDAAHAVAGAPAELVDELVDRSLVAAAPEGRRRLLDTVRAHALERLDGLGETDTTRGRHAAWCLDLARAIEPDSYLSASSADYATFRRELPNLRRGLRYLIETRDGAGASRLIRALAPYLYTDVSRPEGRQLAALTLALPGVVPRDRGRILYYDACLTMDMGLADETRATLGEAETLFTRARDPEGLSMVENLRCFHEASVGNYAAAAEAGEQAVAHAERARSADLAQIGRDHLAFALLGLGADCDERDEEALRRCRDIHLAAIERAERPYEVFTAAGNAIPCLLELDDVALAVACLRRNLEMQREHQFHAPYALLSAAYVADVLDDPATAIRLLVPCLRELEAKSFALSRFDRRRIARLEADAVGALGAEPLEAIRREAQRLTAEDALDLAVTVASSEFAETRRDGERPGLEGPERGVAEDASSPAPTSGRASSG